MALWRQENERVLLESPKFFKIVFDNSVHKLRIPTKFSRQYGQNLPDSIFLKVGGGPVLWKVELIRCDGEIWMQNGWREFNEHYSLDFGHLLVFKYVGKSCFNVVIFDLSATEIEYPIPHANNAGLESDHSDSVVCLEEFNNKGKGKIIQEATQEEDDVSLEILDTNPTPRHQKRRKRPIANDHSAKKRSRKESSKYVVKTCETARAFMSDKNTGKPFLVSLMQPSYVSNLFILSISRHFAKENLPKEKSNDIVLSVSKGKRWPVRCSIGNVNAKIFGVGWKEFVQDNKLKVGDACVFEVTKTAKPEWNVIIFRS